MWVTIAISGGALAVSALSLTLSFMSYRAAGPRISIVDYRLTFDPQGECWLEVKVSNSGRSDVTLDGSWANWLGATVSTLPHRLTSGSSYSMMFRGRLPPNQFLGGSMTVQIGLGNGQSVLKRIAVDSNQTTVHAGRDTAPASLEVQVEEV